MHEPKTATPDYYEWKRRWIARMETWDDTNPIA
jgi:hypothetical protein